MADRLVSGPWKTLLGLAFWIYIGDCLFLSFIYLATCSCDGQAFNAWFFPAFHHPWWTFYWTFHGITWLAGPYSIIWWVLNLPAFYGFWPFYLYLFSIGTVFTLGLISSGHRGVAVFWATMIVWFIPIDPVDFFPVLAIFIGRFRWPFLALAPVIKLPFGAPWSVWLWVFTNRDSLSGPENWGRYLLLGTLWTTMLCLNLYYRRKSTRFSRQQQFSPSSP